MLSGIKNIIESKKMKKNCILVDWKPSQGWDFQEELQRQTNQIWDVLGLNASGTFRNKTQKIIRHYVPYFLFPLRIFFIRNRYQTIMGWQQFFGLILAYYCKLFRVRKYPKIVILTFIYKEKTGIFGKKYFSFMKSILQSGYINKVIVYSQHEKDYYTHLFGLREGIVDYCLYAGEEGKSVKNKFIQKNNQDTPEGAFFIAPGRSNRDYDFLVRELKNTEYRVKIICDNYRSKIDTGNIMVYNNVFGEQYTQMLKDAYAVIVPLLDENISSGQLVFLKAMQYGKPIIVTANKSITDYVKNDFNGIIVEKDGNQLRKKMEQLLKNADYYNAISCNAVSYYNQYFNTGAFVRQILQRCNQS